MSQAEKWARDDCSTSTNTSSTTKPCPVIEEYISTVVNNNLYHVTKSQDEKHKQNNFMQNIQRAAKRVDLKQHKTKNPKLTSDYPYILTLNMRL